MYVANSSLSYFSTLIGFTLVFPVTAPRTSLSTFGSSSNLGTQSAPVETLEEQAKGWSLGIMDQLVWIKVGGGEYGTDQGGFWWPGDVCFLLLTLSLRS